MPVFVRRQARRSPPLATRIVHTQAHQMLAHLGMAHAELSVLLTDDVTIRALNLKHRGTDRTTDVLAFPLDGQLYRTSRRKAADVEQLSEAVLLGDVVISLDTAARQGKARRQRLTTEVRFLLAHGLLHLLGYDHDTASNKKEMDRMTARLVRAAAVR